MISHRVWSQRGREGLGPVASWILCRGHWLVSCRKWRTSERCLFGYNLLAFVFERAPLGWLDGRFERGREEASERLLQ